MNEGMTVMPKTVEGWPVKTRELHTQIYDSTPWNDFRFRDDDIVIATWAKSGTTWMQQIVSQLLFDGMEGLEVAEMSPWLDFRVPPKDVKLAAVEAQTHRRFIKTHLPVDALVYSRKAKYIYIGRDGRDVIWSLHNHWLNGNDLNYAAVNDSPGRIGPPIERPPKSPRDYFMRWLQQDGYPFTGANLWDNVRTWWKIRDLPNLLLLHFANLKANLAGQILLIAEFLDIEIDPTHLPAILDHCSFSYMKAHGAKSVPLGGAFWDGGAETFIHKGTNGRWSDQLSTDDCRLYEETARRELGDECAAWLATGHM
jgi:aryl sulfotransferase